MIIIICSSYLIMSNHCFIDTAHVELGWTCLHVPQPYPGNGEELCGGNDPGAGNSQQFPSCWLWGLGTQQISARCMAWHRPSWTIISREWIDAIMMQNQLVVSMDLKLHGSPVPMERFNYCPQSLMRFCQRLGLLGPDLVAPEHNSTLNCVEWGRGCDQSRKRKQKPTETQHSVYRTCAFQEGPTALFIVLFAAEVILRICLNMVLELPLRMSAWHVWCIIKRGNWCR